MLTERHASFTIDIAVLNTKPSGVEIIARVREHVFNKWKEFGDHLHVLPNLIDAIHQEEQGDCSRAFRSLCFKWLKEDPDTGDRPRTWRTVLDAMRGCGEVRPAKDVEESLISNPPSPPPTLTNRVFSKSEYESINILCSA